MIWNPSEGDRLQQEWEENWANCCLGKTWIHPKHTNKTFKHPNAQTCSYLHQNKVRGAAEGMRKMLYTDPMCNRSINMTFLHTMILRGLGPSFSLYVWSKASSVFVSEWTFPLLDLCCFFSSVSASVIVAESRWCSESKKNQSPRCCCFFVCVCPST